MKRIRSIKITLLVLTFSIILIGFIHDLLYNPRELVGLLSFSIFVPMLLCSKYI